MTKTLRLALIILLYCLYRIFLLLNWFINWITPTYNYTGIYCVVGATGSGKSLFKTYLESRENRKHIILSNVKSLIKNVATFKIHDIILKGDVKVNLLGSGVKLLTFDEPQLTFSNVDFKNEDYNEFVRICSLHRHLGIDRVFFFTQSWDALPKKLRDLTHYVIDIEHTKRIKISDLVDKKQLNLVPNKLKLVVFPKRDYEDNLQYYEQVKKGFFNTKVKLEDLDRYRIKVTDNLLKLHDTYVFKDYYSHLPTYKVDIELEPDLDVKRKKRIRKRKPPKEQVNNTM